MYDDKNKVEGEKRKTRDTKGYETQNENEAKEQKQEESEKIYLMLTFFEHHWDDLQEQNNRTYYPKDYLERESLENVKEKIKVKEKIYDIEKIKDYLERESLENVKEKIKDDIEKIEKIKDDIEKKIGRKDIWKKTIFIKTADKTKNYEPQKAWVGFVSDIEKKEVEVVKEGIEKEKVGEVKEEKAKEVRYYFKVNIVSEVNNLENIPQEFKKKKPGWYLVDEPEKYWWYKQCGFKQELSNELIYKSIDKLIDKLIYTPDLLPSSFKFLKGELFNELLNPTDCFLFEDFTYYLLKLIGINTIFKYNRKNQQGRADGFFTVGDLAVIYDCTTDENFLSRKSTQIENYCNQLFNDKIQMEPEQVDFIKTPIEINVGECSKEVWIITPKGESNIIERKMRPNECKTITVKQVAIKSLIDIYLLRFTEIQTDKDLAERLKGIGI